MFSWANLEGQRIGPYHLEKLLGAGTFGAVFKANEVVRDRFIRSVAIKIYREGPNIPFKFPLEELIATTGLEHPNIIRGYVAREDEVGKTGFKVLYLVMELADGTLNHYRRANSLKSQEIREIAIAIASGLIYLHKQGKIHRDLKPDNILRVKKIWKLSDLGLIRDLGTRSYLETQHLSGTVAYMSPEVFDGIISPAFDVWSLGIILVELTTGSVPYQYNDENHLMKRVMNYELQLPTLPDEFKPIILRCLQKDRQRRWTAQQVLSFLQPPIIKFATTGENGSAPFINFLYVSHEKSDVEFLEMSRADESASISNNTHEEDDLPELPISNAGESGSAPFINFLDASPEKSDVEFLEMLRADESAGIGNSSEEDDIFGDLFNTEPSTITSMDNLFNDQEGKKMASSPEEDLEQLFYDAPLPENWDLPGESPHRS